MTARPGFATLLLAAALCGFCGTRTHAADTYYATTSIVNPTNSVIHYQFRWGSDSEWRNWTLAPGRLMTHYYEYDYPNENHSPTPQIRFDCIGGDGEVSYKVYDLKAYAASCTAAWASKKYNFRYSWDGHFLDLFSSN